MVLVVGSPEWWMKRLYDRLLAHRGEVEFYTAYYEGDHPLPWLAPQARDEFRRLVRMTRSNYMGLVPDTYAEGISVEGFRLGDEGADRDLWRIWQTNNLDSDADQAFLEALIGGRSYLLVGPNPDDRSTPNIWVEHPSQAIVDFVPGSNRRQRAAGLKVWDDDWTSEIHATLYLPDAIYKYRAKKPVGGTVAHPEWSERVVPGEQPNGQRINPFGVVPLIEMPCQPRLLTGGVSVLSDVTDIQDRVNKTLFDRMQTQEFGVDPQKWGTAFPKEDEDGNPQTVEFGRNRMVTTDIEQTRFGNFAVAPLAPLSEAKRDDVKDIAARKRIPADYLLGELNNVNGETLKASRAGLVAVTKQLRRPFGEALEEAMRLARRAAGSGSTDDTRMETLWTNPEFRTEGELTDAVIKRLQAGLVSKRQAREDLGYSAEQIARMESEDDAAALDPVADRLLRDVTGQSVDAAGG